MSLIVDGSYSLSAFLSGLVFRETNKNSKLVPSAGPQLVMTKNQR